MNNSKVIILKMIEKLQNVENCDKLAYPSGTILISVNIVKMVEKNTKNLQQSHIKYISRSNSEKSISSNELVSSSAGSGLYLLFLNSGEPGSLMIVGSGLYFLF